MHHARATHPHRTMPATKRTWPALAGCCALAVLVFGPWETVTAETGQPALYGIISEEVNVSERQPVRLVPHGPLVRDATPGAGGVPDDSDVPGANVAGGANGADKTNGTPDADGAPHANSGHGVHGVDGLDDADAATASARVPASSADVASGHAETTTPPADTAGVMPQTAVPQRPARPVRPDAQTATHSPAPSGIPHAVGDGARVAPSGRASGTTTSQPSGPAARPADAPAAVTTATPASATRSGTTSGTVHSTPSVSQHATAPVSEHATASVSQNATASASQHATASVSQHATTSENLLDSMDVYALSPHAARLALPRMVPVVVAERLRVARPAFPFWESAIDKASRTHALDPRLIAAVIRAESGYDPGAVSPRGAQGVMQIMPATQRELGLDDPFDPEANVEAGSRYLRQQLDRFGSLELALAAYNAGPGNVLKYGGMPPFDETRTFVRRVLDGMR
ncbi:transglycosylase SLT domain-containing protein [Nitratidesulfovibrio vulgaris]|uniref:transglycosylase SLT domain-containing protein n=1 Tax=Nitratidesulfovibrio vulgaris TaxID=881 RepID=UPI0022FFF21C|nr:transglycosylase SLT domain-containing protein [Nitratidesulfovibrio vulgaris]WCB48197.1 transglycosylase SLT domain-containing protein [Nitratidesulfovibrio vulgaris]